MAVHDELAVLLTSLLNAGDKNLKGAYAIGKGYAAAKSGFDVEANPIDVGLAAKSIDFNAVHINDLVRNMEDDIMRINPGNYATAADYMADVDKTFDRYASRASSITAFAEQPFKDGFIQGGKEVQTKLASKLGVSSDEVGFVWATVGDERVCDICRGLDGTWFPLDHGAGVWSAHIGCRCPEYFRYGVKR